MCIFDIFTEKLLKILETLFFFVRSAFNSALSE